MKSSLVLFRFVFSHISTIRSAARGGNLLCNTQYNLFATQKLLFSTRSTMEQSSNSVTDKILEKCQESFEPLVYHEIINESSSHSVPKGSETHFKVILVSNKFTGLIPVQRHRLVYNLLKPEMRVLPEDNSNYHKIHALSIIAKTEDEWAKEKETIDKTSPKCLGGSKMESKK
jgi:stress-induced morphogen